MHAAHQGAGGGAQGAGGAHAGHDVDRRGDAVMGFSHETTKHTFRLTKGGGAIEVRATDPKDAESIARIRTHLADIAKRFPTGDFAQPEEIHGRKPDGTDVMQELRTAIDWRYEPIERGGRVVIATKDTRALDAIHRFLRFQISDHRTGDTEQVE